MQFNLLITGLISALVSTSAAATLDLRATAPKALAARTVIDECTEANDCCISTRGACTRQAFNWAENYLTCPFIKLCPDLGVPWSSCGADCCSISTKWGRGCPGK
ncbi:hypothetical protein CkaCkLH20_07827 [Colletotrichum karsti]|uniref:Uncharacterized protein n=1 Tax=Colletotrichum karsti TaxID=1095194 RepID=A0A9P6I9W0_9PEZI|nr:uncharacterized protein CkaCkLH20_07827 [Colletotrichum karsti]KAF9874690.1 hypothetical protein CkaCkLH20_07827 [Colletotrichum karsti]